ncbi:MAG: hypothetical protein HY791_03790 [Deltaproteobacteria bacterium]|nr:hypothetical protein [Deltaproteobacteria bacterium]
MSLKRIDLEEIPDDPLAPDSGDDQDTKERKESLREVLAESAKGLAGKIPVEGASTAKPASAPRKRKGSK